MELISFDNKLIAISRLKIHEMGDALRLKHCRYLFSLEFLVPQQRLQQPLSR